MYSNIITNSIKGVTDGSGFTFRVNNSSSHRNFDRPQLVRLQSLANPAPVLSSPEELVEGWNNEAKPASAIHEKFIGLTTTKTSTTNIDASANVPIAGPISLGTGASVDVKTETYRFTCRINIDKVTEQKFFTPPKDIKARWKGVKSDLLLSQTHYVDHVVLGGNVYFEIEYTIRSRDLAMKIHTKLAGIPDLEQFLEFSRTLHSEEVELKVGSCRPGFDTKEVLPKYEKGGDLLKYYASVSDWISATPVPVASELYFHATPLSSADIELRPHESIEEQYAQLAENESYGLLLSDPAIRGSISSEKLLELQHDRLLSNADPVSLQCGNRYLAKGTDGHLTFSARPDLAFRLVPSDGTVLISSDIEAFELQTEDGGATKYVKAEKPAGGIGKPSYLTLTSAKTGIDEYYQFKLLNFISDKPGSLVTAQAERYYILVAQKVHKSFMFSTEEHDKYYLNKDGRLVRYSDDATDAAQLSLTPLSPGRMFIDERVAAIEALRLTDKFSTSTPMRIAGGSAAGASEPKKDDASKGAHAGAGGPAPAK